MYKLSTVLPQKVKESTDIMLITPEKVAEIAKDMESLAQEAFQVLTLDIKNRMIDRHLISLGTLNSSLAHPREVFRAAILDNAACIILVHNHPSGDPTPSSEDIKITKQMIGAGEVMEIKVLDHVIIGRATHLSLRESGLCKFD